MSTIEKLIKARGLLIQAQVTLIEARDIHLDERSKGDRNAAFGELAVWAEKLATMRAEMIQAEIRLLKNPPNPKL
jgi:hypothetical protein